MTEWWLWNGCSRFLQNVGTHTESCGIICWEVVGEWLYRMKPQTPRAASVWKVCFVCTYPSCGHFPDDCTSCVLVAVYKDFQNLCCYWQISSCPPSCCKCHVVLAALCHNNMDLTAVGGKTVIGPCTKQVALPKESYKVKLSWSDLHEVEAECHAASANSSVRMYWWYWCVLLLWL